jgi:hypothetical protein
MSCSLSKYSNIFGAPGTGVHSYRFMGTAIVDYVATIFLAVLLTWFTGINLVTSTILMFVLGIFFHYIFGVRVLKK